MSAPLPVVPLYGECERCAFPVAAGVDGLDIATDCDGVRRVRRSKTTVCCEYCGSEATADACFACTRTPARVRTESVCRLCKASTILLRGVYYAADEACAVAATCGGGGTGGYMVLPEGCCARMCLGCYLECLRGRMAGAETVTRRGADGGAQAVTVSGCACGRCDSCDAPWGLLSLADRALYDKFNDRSLFTLLSGRPHDCVLCPYPGCTGAMVSLPPVEEQPCVQCPACRLYFCRHPGCTDAAPFAVLQDGVWRCPVEEGGRVDMWQRAIDARRRVQAAWRTDPPSYASPDELDTIATPCPGCRILGDCTRLVYKDDACNLVT